MRLSLNATRRGHADRPSRIDPPGRAERVQPFEHNGPAAAASLPSGEFRGRVDDDLLGSTRAGEHLWRNLPAGPSRMDKIERLLTGHRVDSDREAPSREESS